MKRLLSMLLIAVILASMLSACHDGSGETKLPDEGASTTSGEEANVAPDVLLIADGKSEYVIVRSEKCQAYVLDAIANLRDSVNAKYNVTIRPQDDWVKEIGEEGYVSDACEILIGATNRKESREVLQTLKPGEYKVCVNGNKLVIVGYSDFLTAIAVEEFINSVVASADSQQLVLSSDYSVLETQADYYGVLTGITMYAMGDSYFAGMSLGKDKTWVNQMGEKYNMHYVNYGINGSVMSNFITSNSPMVERFTSMEKGDADVILLEGGRNDRSAAVPIGTVDSRDSQTFMGAINVMLDSMLETYPNALIVLITPWYTAQKVSTGLSNVDYADAMRTLAEHRNDPRIVCLYAADRQATGVDMDSGTFRARYCLDANDVSHLNEDGMKMIQPYMERFIATEFARFKGVSLNG